MSSFSSGNGERPTVPPEYDSQERYADVFLYDYDTTGFGLSSTYKHWTLVFEFEDGAVRVIEGVNFHGMLLPSFTKVKDPSAKFNSRKGSVTISPKRIRDLALNNPYNNQTYSVLTCNCQSWINVILKEFKFDEETTLIEQAVLTLGIVVLGILTVRRAIT